MKNSKLQSALTCGVMLCGMATMETSVASLPLTSDDLVIRDGTFRLGFGLFFLNRSDQEDKDYLIFQARTEMRYGLSSDLEVYGYVRGSYLDGGQSTDYEVIYKRNPVTKKMDPYHVRTWQDTFKFDDLSLGLKYQFSPDNDTPALLGYLETAVVENTSYVSAKPRIDYGEAWQAGLTTYRQFRPAVLSLALGYHHTPSRKTHYYTYDRYRCRNNSQVLRRCGDNFYRGCRNECQCKLGSRADRENNPRCPSLLWIEWR